MRLWSIHPKYVDRKGLVAVWREALLAQKVLEGKTRGYRHHPQLIRFQKSDDPIASIGFYLYEVYLEATKRNYRFDPNKICRPEEKVQKVDVKKGQLTYEFEHLRKKLILRDRKQHERLCRLNHIEAHPLFRIIEGGTEDWEVAAS
jgi:hypothetical protein